MAKEYRTFQLKMVQYVEEDDSNIIPIHDLISEILKKSPTIQDRHVPPISEIKEGKQCSFIDHISKPPGQCPGVVFRFASYIKGEMPPGLKNDFAHAGADIADSVLKDVKTDERREPALAFHGLALGSAIIIESVKGAGGVEQLAKCLTKLARRHVHAEYPRLLLSDVTSRALSAAIDRAGGVEEVILDVVSARRNPTHEFGKMLRDARSKIGGTDLLRLQYRADKESSLTKKDVLQTYDDYDAHEIDKLVAVLKGGEKFVGDDQCKVRKIVEFVHGITDPAVVRELAKYLLELQAVQDDVAVLTLDGHIPAAQAP